MGFTVPSSVCVATPGTMMMAARQAGAQWCATPPPPEDTECRLMQTLTLLLRSRAMPGSHTGPHLSCCGRTRVRQLRAEPLHCRQEEAQMWSRSCTVRPLTGGSPSPPNQFSSADSHTSCIFHCQICN